jgi:tetratricopeptide (TPR) repeat protein
LAKGGLSLSEIPGAVSLAEDDNIPVGNRIKVLQCFLADKSDADARDKLIGIARKPETSYSHLIDAISCFATEQSGDEIERLLDGIVYDAKVPPEWRLRAASPEWPVQRRSKGPEHLIHIIRDESVTISVRLAAFNNLIKLRSREETVPLLDEIAQTPQLANSDRLSIIEMAVKFKAVSVAQSLLSDALTDIPHSISELAEMAASFLSIGQTRRAIEALNELIAVPDTVLQETEDHFHILTAAKLLKELGRSTEAAALLARVLDLVCWPEVIEILDAIGEVASEDAAGRAAETMLARLTSAPSNSANSYMGYWLRVFEHFLAKGWIADLTALLLVAEDPSKLLTDRAQAAAAIYRNSWRERSQDWAAIAQRVLSSLSERGDLSARQRTDLIPILSMSSLSELAQQQIDTLVGLCDLRPEERRAVSILLFDKGDTKRAKKILEGIPDSEEARGWFGPRDDMVIAELQGKEQLERIEVKRVVNNYGPMIDRLLSARELVSKYGNKQALRLIWNTAYDTVADPNDRLQAIEALDDLGYRGTSRELLPGIIADPRVDDYWAGDLLLSFGNKSEALKRFRQAILNSPKDYRDQIAWRLADLQAVDLLDELDNVISALQRR